MTRRWALCLAMPLAAVLLAAFAALSAHAQEATPAAERGSVGGVADLKVTTGDHRVSLRVLFAASGDPARFRIEVVRAGTLAAVAWYDTTRVLIYAPTEGLLHEGPPTRETLETALGLPFCPADILHALRGGQPPVPPPCDTSGHARTTTIGSGADAAVEIAGAGELPTKLQFSRFREVGGRRWPHRVSLESVGARAIVDIVAISYSPLEPMPPGGAALASARRVTAAEMAEGLGIARWSPPRGDHLAGEPSERLGR